MKSRRKNLLRVLIVVFLFAIFLVFMLIQIRSANEKTFQNKRNHPEILFHGIFNTSKNLMDPDHQVKGDEICIFFRDENIGYDEKKLTFSNDEKGTFENFNYYRITKPEGIYDKDSNAFKTTWYLCKYDDAGSLILLDENNEESGRISFAPREKDFFGRKEFDYYWIKNGKTIPIYKYEDTPYSQGDSYLKSKYYTGKFLRVETDS